MIIHIYIQVKGTVDNLQVILDENKQRTNSGEEHKYPLVIANHGHLTTQSCH